MFESLSDRFDNIFKRLSGRGKLSEADVDEVMREIRVALLEADVNLAVVRGFIERVKERCVGEEVGGALNPTQTIIKIVSEELTATLGGETISITYNARPPTVVLMAGLQGSGKTTNSAKLGAWFKRQGRNPLMVGADLQRPAAVEQLRTLGRQIDVPVFSETTDPVSVATAGLLHARETGRDVVIVDTAGRLAIDDVLMEEVRQISLAVDPDYTFLVVDAMTGQDAVTVAENFHATLALDGVILTKLDGDARGGAALSVKEVVGKPIAFASTGEKIEDFDLFHPDRLAGRILGMGDVLTLIEKAEQVYEEEEAEQAAMKLMEGTFTLDDFLAQMQQIKKMGPIGNLLSMMPGIPNELRNTEIDDRELARVEGIIQSMTPAERADPAMIDTSRRGRIATGAGVRPIDVSNLVKQFRQMQKMLNQLGGFGTKGRRNKKKQKKERSGGRVTPKGLTRSLKMPDLEAELRDGLPDDLLRAAGFETADGPDLEAKPPRPTKPRKASSGGGRVTPKGRKPNSAKKKR